ncbi:MAG TPA: hypothetical protein VGF26_08435 [Ramlibacter sp.]
MTAIRHSLARTGATALLLLAAYAGAAHAGGTQAGTTISNSATLNYTVGGTTQNPICSSQSGNTNNLNCANNATTFTVDNKIDLLVQTTDTTAVTAVPGGTAATTFTVKNQGNFAQDFELFVTSNFSSTTAVLNGTTYTDTVDPGSCTVTDTAGTAIPNSRISGLGIDQTTTVKVSCTFPALNGTSTYLLTDVAVVGLKATARASGGGTLTASTTNNQNGTADILFADGKGSYNDDGLRDASYTDRSAFKMKPAVLTVSKTVATICDPTTGDTSGGNSPRNIPGAIIRYTITVSNAATASTATLGAITDALNANLTFDPNMVTGANPTCSAATGTPTSAAGKGVRFAVSGSNRVTTYPKFVDSTAVLSGQTLTFDNVNSWPTALPAETGYLLGDLKAGETLTIDFNVTIN